MRDRPYDHACVPLRTEADGGTVKRMEAYIGDTDQTGYVYSLKYKRRDVLLSYCPFCGVKMKEGRARCNIAGNEKGATHAND